MRICFFALNAYPTLSGTRESRVGGAEVQQKLLSKYLLDLGHDVSFVTRDHGQVDGDEIGGIKVYKAFTQGAGLPYLRFIHPRCTKAWGALKKADADIYYQRCAGMETGLLAAFCAAYDKKFIFASASDSDFDLSRVIVASRRDSWLYVYGLKRANMIITQTQRQRDLLAKNFGLKAEVISNCWSQEGSVNPMQGSMRRDVLWVSTLRSWKRPEQVTQLARQKPDMHFVMVGGAATGDEELYESIKREAQQLENMSFIGFVPFADVGKKFDDARIVINTSEPKEGFPNSFLQAWQRGIPVISYFDPDDIIRKERVGYVVSTVEEMAAALTALEDKETYREYSQRAVRYFNDNHLIDSIGPSYERVLEGLA